MDNVQWPLNPMQDTAKTLKTENDTLQTEHTQRWQKIHDATTSLPTSMQLSFSTLHTSLQTNLASSLTLHKHIAQTLSDSADLTGRTDTSISQGFDGFQP